MDDFLRDLALLLLGAFVGSFIAPFITQLRTLPYRTRNLFRVTDRARLDHKRFARRKERALTQALARVDEEMNARGILGSTIHQERRDELIEDYRDRLEDDWSVMIRTVEDAGGFPGRLEKAYMKWRLKKHPQPSAEDFILEGGRERLEAELKGEQQL